MSDVMPGRVVMASEATERAGARRTLLLVFICLLGGRFSLDRVSEALPAVDLRFFGLAIVIGSILAWQPLRATYEPHRRLAGVGAGHVLFLTWVWFMAAAGMWAPPGARVVGNVLDLAFMAAFVALGWFAASHLPRRSVSAVWRWSAVAGVVYLVAALVAGPDLQGRYAAFGGGPNVFVRVMVLAVLGALYLAAIAGASRWAWLIPLFTVGAVLSGSRGGLLALVIVGLLGAWPLLRRTPRRVARRLVLSGVLSALAVPFLVDPTAIRDLRYRFVVLTFENGYSSGRDMIWADVWDLFGRSPVIGAGLDGYYGLVGQYSGFLYPHNLVFAVLAEAGIIGIVLLGITSAALVLTVVSGRNEASLYLGLAALYLAVTSMFSGDYYDSRMLWFFLGLAALEARRPSRVARDR